MKSITLTLILIGSSGCVDTIGPFVRDVSIAKDGGLRIRSCEIELHRSIFTSATMNEGECTSKVVQP